MYEGGNLVAGSVDDLIQHMVPTATYKPEVSTELDY